jgi:lysophospholipase L1-like esterase
VKKILVAIMISLLSGKVFSITPNLIISRGKPTYSNADQSKVSKLVDGTYLGSSYSPSSWEAGSATSSNPKWAAIKVGPGYTRLLVSLNVGANALTYDGGSNGPEDYKIQTSNNSTNGSDGTWNTEVTITGSRFRTRAHSFDFTGMSWVRLYITKSAGSSIVMDEIDVYDISGGISDTWIFVGDSITNSAYTRNSSNRQPSFAKNINSSHPSYYPAMLNAGISGTDSIDWKTYIDTCLAVNPDFKYWCIGLGTNDSTNHTPCLSKSVFKANLQIMIDKIKAAGYFPILATVPALDSSKPVNRGNPGINELVHPEYNDAINELTQENNLVCSGPDLFNWFLSHPEELASDGEHPSSAGLLSMNLLWAESVGSLYVTDTSPPTDIATVNDGTSPSGDIDSTYSTSQLSANWTLSTDGESGVSRYEYAIGTTPGGTDIAGWTGTGGATSVTRSDLPLNIGETYYFSVKAVNGAGIESNVTSSNGQSVLAGGTGDETPPVISSVKITNITRTGAVVNWDTDEPATSQVLYGLLLDYENSTVEDISLVTSHSVELEGLTAGTKYHYKVVSRDVSNNESWSIDYTFITALPDEVDVGGEVDVRVYPSPYILSESNPMTFSVNGTTGGEVKIYTISGRFVKELYIPEGVSQGIWNITNEAGNEIKSGIYVYVIVDGEGNKKIGKIAIAQ